MAVYPPPGSGGVSQITAGTGISLSPAGGTGNVTIAGARIVSGTYTGDGETQQIIVISGMVNAKVAILSEVIPGIGSNRFVVMYSSATNSEGQFIDSSPTVMWIDQQGGVGGTGFTVRGENGFNNGGVTYKYFVAGAGA